MLLLATIYPEIKRVVAYMPSSLVWRGFSRQQSIQRSCWTYKGQALPFASFAHGRFDEHGWQDQATIEAASIPVEKISAPLLLISATNDNVWPSTRMANDIMARMTAADSTQMRKHLELDKAGHNLGVPNLPTMAFGNVNRAGKCTSRTTSMVGNTTIFGPAHKIEVIKVKQIFPS